jgi:hypothetical protein
LALELEATAELGDVWLLELDSVEELDCFLLLELDLTEELETSESVLSETHFQESFSLRQVW